MSANPNVKIVHNKAAVSQDARTNYFAKLGKEGLAERTGKRTWRLVAGKIPKSIMKAARRR